MRRGQALATAGVIVAVIVVAAAIYLTRRPPEQPASASTASTVAAAQAGSVAPEFNVPTTDGPFDLAKQRKPVLLEIFASWCPHCQRETVVLNRLYHDFKPRVSFIAVPGSNRAMDGISPESEADIFNFIQRFTVSYPVAIYDPSLTVAQQYLQGGFPTIAIIGRNKKILYLDSGEVAYGVLAGTLNKALASR